MKLLALPTILFGTFAIGQTFSSSPSTLIADFFAVTETIDVTGVGRIDCDYGLTEVCIDITHWRLSDLDIYLIDPNGDVYELTTDNGGTGDNYESTCFAMDALIDVPDGTAPFTGSFIPEGNLGLVNNYQSADDTWTLYVYDDRVGFLGLLNSWSLTFGPTPPCPGGPTLEDCGGGLTICSDVTLEGNSDGDGLYRDLDSGNDGCLSGENESSWYYFQAASDGNYAFTIETLVDYDFAIWGPLTEIECPPAAPPMRCSYAGVTGNTGLVLGAGDDNEDEFGDGWVNSIDATELDIYVIVIDNFTADGSSFDLSWTLLGGGSFDCALLPISLISFEGVETNGTVELVWKTKSENNNDYFIIEKSADGINWEELGKQTGAGNSSNELSYSLLDFSPTFGINYYRLSQVDFNGTKLPYETISIDLEKDTNRILKIINLMGEEVDENYQGIRVEIYEDGSQRKVVKE